jgi:hypothetical protein
LFLKLFFFQMKLFSIVVLVAIIAFVHGDHGPLLQQFRSNSIQSSLHHGSQDVHNGGEDNHPVNNLSAERDAFVEHEEGAVMQRLANIQHVEAEEMHDINSERDHHSEQEGQHPRW